MQFACNRKEIFYISLLSLFVRKLVESENIENRAELQDKKTLKIEYRTKIQKSYQGFLYFHFGEKEAFLYLTTVKEIVFQKDIMKI